MPLELKHNSALKLLIGVQGSTRLSLSAVDAVGRDESKVGSTPGAVPDVMCPIPTVIRQILEFFTHQVVGHVNSAKPRNRPERFSDRMSGQAAVESIPWSFHDWRTMPWERARVWPRTADLSDDLVHADAVPLAY
jgi:hypothetical protein